MGIVVSLAIAGAVFQNEAFRKVVSVLPNVDRGSLREAITGTNSAYFDTLSNSDRDQLLSGVVSALSSVYVVVIVAGAVTVLVAFLLPVGHGKPPT